MTQLTQTPSANWQMAIGQPGQIVTDQGDIDQCLRIILTTPKGSDPLRPEFACDLWRYLDAPLAYATPHIVREAWDAIETFEPRITLIRITPRLGDEPGHMVLNIQWQRAGQPGQTEVTL